MRARTRFAGQSALLYALLGLTLNVGLLLTEGGTRFFSMVFSASLIVVLLVVLGVKSRKA